ncbi:MAG: peptidoglycan-binding protein [Eubacteriales bacterium]|nr:peptidoglycan-binding protein [Eubacteriales bacterium]
MKEQNRNARSRKWALLVLAAAVALSLSSCYMEPDRIVDDGNGLTVGTGGQDFAPVVTDSPAPTSSPTIAPANTADNQQIDWSEWQFGTDTATDPPSNVISIGTDAPSATTGTSGVTQATVSPSPTPTTAASSDVLKSGASGTAVKQLQQRLKELGYYTGSVDGSYGSGTTNAVKDFQAANNLTADGVAGKKTQQTLYGYYAVAKGSTTTSTATKKPSSSSGSGSSSSGGSSSSTSTSTSTTNKYTNGKTDIYLQLGSSGAQVKILQNRLIVLGYMSGTADGDFAETTEAAVLAFQKRNSIYADGVAGPTTLTKLYSSSAKKASSVVANLGSLKEGMNGSGVRSLQTQLKSLGYYTGSVDGDYGAGTTSAVTAFQGDHGLTQDGVAGKATLNAIYAAVGGGSSGGSGSTSSGTSPSTYGATASTNGYSSISTTSKNSTANVTALQNALQSKSYYSGTLDGNYGSGTQAAVEAYQKAAGLRVTGTAGPTTQRLLYNSTNESGSYSKLSVGSKGTAVKNLQYTLYELKYYDGNITGTYDEATQNAVMTFQQVNGLQVDGIAGQDTQRRLYSSNALPSNI